jgi:hypothetical protein
MADYSDNAGDTGDSNYSDAAPPATEPSGQEEKSDESPRGLLPKSILMGKDFKPGEEIVLKIEAIHDDEVEVSYATGEEGKGGDEGGSQEAPAPQSSDSGMASMME